MEVQLMYVILFLQSFVWLRPDEGQLSAEPRPKLLLRRHPACHQCLGWRVVAGEACHASRGKRADWCHSQQEKVPPPFNSGELMSTDSQWRPVTGCIYAFVIRLLQGWKEGAGPVKNGQVPCQDRHDWVEQGKCSSSSSSRGCWGNGLLPQSLGGDKASLHLLNGSFKQTHEGINKIIHAVLSLPRLKGFIAATVHTVGLLEAELTNVIPRPYEICVVFANQHCVHWIWTTNNLLKRSCQDFAESPNDQLTQIDWKISFQFS